MPSHINANRDTGIRYGTIYLNNLDPDTAQELWANGTNVSEEEAIKEAREEFEAAVNAENDDALEKGDPLPWPDRCDIEDEVNSRMEHWSDGLQIDEPTIEGECDGVKYGITHLGGAALLWVYFSPVISKALLCSPCVPNAGDLESLDEDGYECYGIPDDWRGKE